MPKFKLKSPEKRASKNINIRLTEATFQEIQKRAELLNVDVTKYMLCTALGRPIRTNNIADLVVELRAIANQQRELYKADRRNESMYREILQAIVNVIISIPSRITKQSD